TDDAQPGDLEHAPRRVGEQLVLVGGDAVETDRGHVVDGSAESDHARDVGRARLELVGQLVVGRLLEGDGQDHVPAALPGRHGLEQGLAAVEHADTGRAVDLV